MTTVNGNDRPEELPGALPDAFEACVVHERQRLTDLLTELDKRQAELAEERAAVETELAAIRAYYQIRTGQIERPAPARGRRARAGSKKVARRGGGRAARSSSRRTRILTMLGGTPEGMTRSEILAGLGIAQGDREARSVSNALANMKKAGQLDNPGGRWRSVERAETG